MANKKYPISQSPLFKLSSKKRLADLLGLSLKEIVHISRDSTPYYRVFMVDDREINEPIGKLRVIHDKLQKFLSRIETPEYLFSGVKGRSSVGNAERHIDCRYMITMDITKFYNSTQKSNVRKMFNNVFRCEGDIAYLLTELVCF